MLLYAGMAAAPPGAVAQSSGIAKLLESPSLILHSSSPGYLGVLVGDVDNDSAAKLKLKEVRGAVVTLIDHDAPAAQAGIRVNDVVIELNGQPVEGAEQFGRMLREIPAGRKVSIVISRDGNLQTLSVELVDHKKMEKDVWNKLDNSGDDITPVTGMGIFSGGGDAPMPGGFHFPFFGSTLNVGALVEPLTSQMAEYLGVPSGLMVKQVTRKSEAATAGLKAFDVILKVGAESIATTADWDRALRSNEGKPVAITILRDRRQQTLSLQVDSKHHHSELEDYFPDGNGPLFAELNPDMASAMAQPFAEQADAMRELQKQLQDQLGTMQPGLMQQQAEKLQKDAETLRDQLKGQQFQFDQKQMDELKQQMKQFRQNFKSQDFENFKVDPKQMDEWRQQMKQFRQNFKADPRQMEEFRHQMEQFKQQMEEMQAPWAGHFV
ncbi:MAG TPA: PDZ domain-containing protein [Terracidiphilus sp.]|nr:PDZ domain-containing protein [Terracidiphilus sp.]